MDEDESIELMGVNKELINNGWGPVQNLAMNDKFNYRNTERNAKSIWQMNHNLKDKKYVGYSDILKNIQTLLPDL